MGSPGRWHCCPGRRVPQHPALSTSRSCCRNVSFPQERCVSRAGPRLICKTSGRGSPQPGRCRAGTASPAASPASAAGTRARGAAGPGTAREEPQPRHGARHTCPHRGHATAMRSTWVPHHGAAPRSVRTSTPPSPPHIPPCERGDPKRGLGHGRGLCRRGKRGLFGPRAAPGSCWERTEPGRAPSPQRFAIGSERVASFLGREAARGAPGWQRQRGRRR